jgi:hypothetical protein
MLGLQIIMMLNTAVLMLIGAFTPTAVTFALWAAAICLEYTWALYVAEKLSFGGRGTNSGSQATLFDCVGGCAVAAPQAAFLFDQELLLFWHFSRFLHVLPLRQAIDFCADVDSAHLLSNDWFGKSPIWCQIKPTDLPSANRQFGVNPNPTDLPSTAGPGTS